MSQQLLVPIKSHDRIEDLLPYLEDLARPDMKIVFLVHFGINRFGELAGQLLEIQSGLPSSFSSDTVIPQSNLARRIQLASQKLHVRGTRIDVKFYSGRLRPILRQYSEAKASKLVIMRPGQNRAWRLCQNLFSALRIARSAPSMPVLLRHPVDI